MAKPKINKIKPFDAENNHNITFSWLGNQAYGNRIMLYDKDTMTTVYDHTVESFSYSHTVPGNTLQNGKCYIVQCQVFDYEWIESALSDKYYFYTLKTPEFKFQNIPDGIIQTSSYHAEVTYKQENFEDLLSYKFAIYDSAKTLLLETDTIFDVDNLSYSFKGLQNDTTYYIRCYGVTYNGMEVDTGYKEIFVSYISPGVYSRLYAECDFDNGCVKYHTNINIIEPSDDSDDFTFEDGKINIIDKTLIYDTGFVIENDFTLKVNGTYLYRDGDVIILKNKNHHYLKITALICPNGQIRYKLIVPNSISQYILYSDPLSCTSADKITIVLRRINNIYQIKSYKEGGDST